MANDETSVLRAMRTMEEGNGFKSGEALKKDEGTQVSKKVSVIKKNPGILLKTLSVLLIVCGAGVATIYVVRNNNIEATEHQSLTMAQETGDFFSNELDKAMLPLLTLAQFMKEMNEFHPLAGTIGPAHQNASAPFTDPVHRNITGICDDQDLISRFDELAKALKRNANMPGVLVNLQVAPQGVLCFHYPMINTEDFSDGLTLDNRGAVGLDLEALPHAKPSVTTTLRTSEEDAFAFVAGPVTLTQCSDCPPTVRQAFILRTVVEILGIHSEFDGESFPNRWGTANVILNWEQLVLRSGMYEIFDERGLEFQLTLKQHVSDDSKQLVVLAETEKFHLHTTERMRTVSVSLDTTHSEWEMTVAYPLGDEWVLYALIATVVVALLISLLVAEALVQRQQFRTMQRRYSDDVSRPQKLRLKLFLEESTMNSNHHTKKTTLGTESATLIDEDSDVLETKQIADMFPHTTILFADIVGFTAWASEREPPLILSLLQTIFSAFDKIAAKRGVFKVETVGDCYVAACGFPDPQADHAVRMVKFAQECSVVMKHVTELMEARLGPGTADLGMRFGIHSGPITAGVLSGNHVARVQFFGDTMNTAARMESSGAENRIHISRETANLLKKAGKHRWIEQRPEKIIIKGKGELQTFWVRSKSTKNNIGAHHGHLPTDMKEGKSHAETDSESISSQPASLVASDLWGSEENEEELLDTAAQEKTARLVEWHVDSMTGLLKLIVSQRQAKKTSRTPVDKNIDVSASITKKDATPLDEVKEIISLPAFDRKTAKKAKDLKEVAISSDAIHQLRHYVSQVALLYREGNPFHNFEHASHVTMAVHKLLSRIITPEDVDYHSTNVSKLQSDLHEYTFGITSDPLTHFAVVLSALIHDVDHTGVSNQQLAKENPSLAEQYRNKSLAEQNSVDIAWNLLMQPQYADLQACIFTNQTELKRFRQIVVQTVLATDIFDSDLKLLRNVRWDKAFHADQLTTVAESEYSFGFSDSSTPSAELDEGSVYTNRKATIVIEHIIQASDVAHTMQHWQVYTKWNEKLFQEMYTAFQQGRSPNDPTEGWVKGELWFFDNYVIPLAKKLADCGVFGVASDECLHNAMSNRREWEARGDSLVAEMAQRSIKQAEPKQQH